MVILVKENNGAVQCSIDDDGIGHELSKKYRAAYESTTNQSKGIGLTQSRLELDKILNKREDAIFILDKEGEDGQPEGTKVILTIRERNQ